MNPPSTGLSNGEKIKNFNESIKTLHQISYIHFELGLAMKKTRYFHKAPTQNGRQNVVCVIHY